MDAAGGGVLRRSRAVPASVGGQWLEAEIAPEAWLLWIGTIGSFQIFLLDLISTVKRLLAVPVASKTGCFFVADVSLLNRCLRNSFHAAETFRSGCCF